MRNHIGFTHRHNLDGTYDSICRCCFRTVATACDEGSLRLIRIETRLLRE